MFDRLVGMTGLITVALVGVFLTRGLELGPGFAPIRFVALICGAVTVAGYAWLLCIPDAKDPVLVLLRLTTERVRMSRPLLKLYESLRYFRAHRSLLLLTIALSMLGFTLTSVGCAFLARALGDTHIPVAAVLVAAPLGLLVSAIPIAPSRVGTGHVAFTALFGSLGSDWGADVFTLYLLYVLCQGALGGLIYLRFKTGIALPDIAPNPARPGS